MRSSEVRIYTPENSLKHPFSLIKEMWRDLAGSRELAWRLLVRDISAQYRQSFLGIFWAFIPPIAMAAGLLMARNAKVLDIGETELPYAAYVMISMTLWQTFSESLNAPIKALQQAKPMLVKLNFPREALILAKFGEVLFNFAIKALLISVILVWYGIVPEWKALLMAPVALLSLIAFGFALGILLAPIGGLYTDISRGLGILIGLWMFITPVIYPVPGSGVFSLVVDLNPVTHLLVTTRELITTGVVSNVYAFALTAAISWLGLLITWMLFRLTMPFIVERMSA